MALGERGGNPGLTPEVRPGSLETKQTNPNNFPFDAFEFTKPDDATPTISVRSPWYFDSSRLNPPIPTITPEVKPYGLKLTYVDGTHISMGAGAEISESDRTTIIHMSTAITGGELQSTGAWSAGSSGKKLNTGAIANSTWYEVHLLGKSTDSTAADWMYTTTANRTTRPTGWDLWAHVGWVATDSGGSIISGKWAKGNREFTFYTKVLIRAYGVTSSTSRQLLTCTLPPSAKALLRLKCNTGASAYFFAIGDPARSDVTVNSETTGDFQANNGQIDYSYYESWTDSSSRIFYRVENTQVYLGVYQDGYYFDR